MWWLWVCGISVCLMPKFEMSVCDLCLSVINVRKFRNPGDTQTDLSHSAYGDSAQRHRAQKIPDILQTDISNLGINHAEMPHTHSTTQSTNTQTSRIYILQTYIIHTDIKNRHPRNEPITKTFGRQSSKKMTSHCKTTGSRTETELSHSAYRDPAQRHQGQKIPLQKGY